MDPDQIIERIGTEEPPTVDELTQAQQELEAAKQTLAADLKAAKDTATLAELQSAKAEYDAVSAAVSKVSEALAAAQSEIDAIVAELDPEPEVEDETPEEVEAEAVPVSASIRSTLARIRTQPREVEPVRDLSKVDITTTLRGHETSSDLSFLDVGQAFSDEAPRFGGKKNTIFSMKMDMHPDRRLDGDQSANERKMLDLFGANPILPVTASGGCCSIPEPIYDQPMLGDLSRPIRSVFDVLQASRGAVTAYPPICIPDAGADVWTCEQDEAVDPDDDSTWKTCVAIECETAEPTLVEAAYKCLTIGTFQQRYAPEQWAAILFQTDKLLARKLEARLFGWLQDAATTSATGFDEGSTYANLVKSLIRRSAAIRQEQRLGDAQMIAVGPSWIYSAIGEDTLTRRLNDNETVEFSKARVDAVLADYGIRYVGSDDVATMNDASYDSSMPDYPDVAPVVLLPAGSAKVLDGGELNLGIDVPDFALARQNTVAAFAESWEGLLVRNCNVAAIDIPIADCDLICPGETPA